MFTDSSLTDVAISIGGTQFTGKNVIVSQLNITQHNDFLEMRGDTFLPMQSSNSVTIDIKLECSSDDLKILDNLLEGKTKIRAKLVENCSIEELLFAIRQKTKI